MVALVVVDADEADVFAAVGAGNRDTEGIEGSSPIGPMIGVEGYEALE